MKTAVNGFLTRHKFDVRPVEAEALLAEFNGQMDAGLAGKAKSLAMIPAYISLGKPVPVNTPVVVMDAGGTNLRTAAVSFDEKGRARMEDFNKYPMPGTGGVTSARRRFSR